MASLPTEPPNLTAPPMYLATQTAASTSSPRTFKKRPLLCVLIHLDIPLTHPSHSFPQSYTDAQADAVPPYWETTVHAPAIQDRNGNMIIDDLPTGPFWVFASNCLISFFFQFVGFLFTYLFHTSHAAKLGSRAGLGLTLIQFGFYSRTLSSDPGGDKQAGDPPPSIIPRASLAEPDTTFPIITSRDLLAFLFMTLGPPSCNPPPSTLINSSLPQVGSSFSHQSSTITESSAGKGQSGPRQTQHPQHQKKFSVTSRPDAPSTRFLGCPPKDTPFARQVERHRQKTSRW